MDRREALKFTTLLTGSALSAGVVGAVLSGCSSRKQLDWVPKILSTAEAEACATIAEAIIPATDTPGALDVGVDQFIDLMIADCHNEVDQNRFKEGLANIRVLAGDDIPKLSSDGLTTLIEKLDDSVDNEGIAFATFRQIKSLTLLGYFTSEEGMKLNFAYRPVPGRYEGCVPFNPGDKVWIGNHVG